MVSKTPPPGALRIEIIDKGLATAEVKVHYRQKFWRWIYEYVCNQNADDPLVRFAIARKVIEAKHELSRAKH